MMGSLYAHIAYISTDKAYWSVLDMNQ